MIARRSGRRARAACARSPSAEPRGLDGGGGGEARAGTEGRRGADRLDLLCAQLGCLGEPQLAAGAEDGFPGALLRRGGRDVELRRRRVPRVDLVGAAPLADRPHRLRRRVDQRPAPARRRTRPAARAGRPRASARSRRSARSARDRRLRLRARPRLPPARARADARRSRGRGSRRRRRRRPRSSPLRAAASARPALPPRATSRSPCAASADPTFGPAAGARVRCGLSCPGRMVAVAQLVEPRVVVPVVAGSNPVRHPRTPERRSTLSRAP